MPSEFTTPIFGAGGFGKGPFPGQESLRVPFVDLFIDGIRIPLLDVGRGYQTLDDPALAKLAGTSTLLLLNFNYSLTATMGAANDVSIDILDPQSDYLMGILAQEDQDHREFSFQFGWRGINDQLRSRRINVVLVGYSVTQESGFQGTKINLRGWDATYRLYNREISGEFPVTTAISEAIRQVLVKVDPRYFPVIEPILTPVGEDFKVIPAGSTPRTYIDSLLKVAFSSRADAEFVHRVTPISDGKILLEILPKTAEGPVVRKYLFHREKDGRLISFSVQVQGNLLMIGGGGRVGSTAVDPRTKQTINVTSTQKEDARVSSKRANNTPDRPTAVYQVPWSSVGQLQGFTKAMRQHADSINWEAEAVVYGDADLVPLQHIRITALRSQVPGRIEQGNDLSVIQTTSGIYRIDEVEHTISAGIFRTSLHLFRNSGLLGSSTDGQAVLLDANAVEESLIDIDGSVTLTPESLA